MYVTLEHLLNAARAGLKISPLYLKRLGDHYVQLSLSPDSGRQTQANSKGHFDLHEYQKFDFVTSALEHAKMKL
jgi:hypothetical protein